MFCVPSMGVTWRCKSSGEPGRRDPERTARRKPGDRPDREVGAERSGERNREPTNRKRPFQASGARRISGDGDQGERPHAREALTAKGQPA